MRVPAVSLSVVFVILISVLFSPAESFSATTGSDVTVLIYHRFGEEKYPTTNVGVERFREQLAFLRDNNYRVISLEQLVDSLKNGNQLPDRAVVITIDDGYRSVYENAWPLLKEFGYPFTVFIYVKATDHNGWNYMTWNQVKEMKAAGVDIQNHGYAHDHMAFKSKETDMIQYRAGIRGDLSLSTKIMSDKLGVRPRYFAIPYGEYNRTLLDEIRSFGYDAILLQDPGSVSSDTDPFAIPREPILGLEWSTMEHFKTVLERVDLPITDEIPEPGLLPDVLPDRISAKLLYPDRYAPGTLGIYVTELGWQRATVDGDTVRIRNSTPLKRQVNRVAVSGREKDSGRTAIRFWMLVGP